MSLHHKYLGQKAEFEIMGFLSSVSSFKYMYLGILYTFYCKDKIFCEKNPYPYPWILYPYPYPGQNPSKSIPGPMGTGIGGYG
jgi:hypothetical protein